MYILGIHDGHNAGACLLKDGSVTAAVSLERLSRVKNDTGYPYAAIKEVLAIEGIKGRDIDRVAVASTERTNAQWFMNTDTWYQSSVPAVLANAELAVPAVRALHPVLSSIQRKTRGIMTNQQLVSRLSKDFGIDSSKVRFIDHHLSHAAASYFSKPWDGDTLILTYDGRGDGVCATVSIGEGTSIRRISHTPGFNSIAEIYLGVTAYLGMKPLEHEYKIMGLAPYASEKHGDKAYEKFKGIVSIKDDLSLRTKFRTNISYWWVKNNFEHVRFDNVAYAVQKFTETVTIEWVRKALKKTGLKKVVLGGGLFMNVKLNKLIMELPEVEKVFVMPSCGDESLMIGAAQYDYAQFGMPSPIEDIYYGRGYSDEYVKKAVSKLRKKYTVQNFKDMSGTVADLLGKHEVVARCAGRMEFGARALGNRSILSNPSEFTNIRLINKMIKSRDFWMPFAPSIAAEFEKDYIVNPKKVPAPYMILAFDTVEKNQSDIVAATHQYDSTARPQVVYKKHNAPYSKIIHDFKKNTGIGTVLNTSFNLHGFPIVHSPEDAIYVFENSGLRHLQLNNTLISKK